MVFVSMLSYTFAILSQSSGSYYVVLLKYCNVDRFNVVAFEAVPIVFFFAGIFVS